MQLITITRLEEGQRLDKFLTKYMNAAPKSFFYKMMRKKNITLNGKKCEGNEKIQAGDEIRLFLSDETIHGFCTQKARMDALPKAVELNILYEDEHVLIIDKPAGILSQKAEASDISMNEQIIAYLLAEKKVTGEQFKTFQPAVCNRLDRNTSGILLAGKTLSGLQALSKALHDRTIHKYYSCIVIGQLSKEMTIKGYLLKQEDTNQVFIYEQKEAFGSQQDQAQKIITRYCPVKHIGNHTLLEVELITGRTHQIRSHLAAIRHPIIGDNKYGSKKDNMSYKKQYGLKHQLLHAARIEFPDDMEGILKPLAGACIRAPLPGLFDEFHG